MDAKELKALYAEMLKDLTKSIEGAKVENEESRKMQDFIVEKITVQLMLRQELPSMEFIQRGIDHYCRLGVGISRNDVRTKLTQETMRLQEIKDPKKLKEILETYEKHKKEVMTLIKPHTIIRPRF